MSSLLNLQAQHVLCTSELIAWAYKNGYKITWGETYRTPEQAAINSANGSGILHSLHLNRLAVDLNVFKDGVFLTTVDDYRPLGDYWKTLHPDARWGGDFSKPDADHFSLTWQGVQ